MSIFPPKVKMMLLYSWSVLPRILSLKKQGSVGRSCAYPSHEPQGADRSACVVSVLGLRDAGFHPSCWEYVCAFGVFDPC